MDIQHIIKQIRTLDMEAEDLSDLFSSFAIEAYQEYKKLGRIGDIDRAIEYARESIRIGHDSDPAELLEWLNNLGIMLGSRYDRTGEMGDLEEAMTAARRVVESTPLDSPYRARRLSNLASKLIRRYNRSGQMGDLEEAITVTRQAVESTPQDNPDRADHLKSLGNHLESRYVLTGEMGDMEEAITATRQAVESTPQGNPDRADYLNSLGNKLVQRYDRTRAMSDLEEAIKAARQAVELTPHDHQDPAAYLSNLGNKLSRRYDQAGETRDLEEAITVTRQAIDSTPHSNPDRAIRLHNLGIMLKSRYQRTGVISDLEEAITIARQAVKLIPHDHQDRAACLDNFGNQLRSRYERTGEMSDLQEAITAARQAVESTPLDRPYRASMLNNLGIMLKSRYQRTGEISDLEEAITATRQAIESTPLDHPNRAAYLNNFGNQLGSRYERTGEMSDLEEAIVAARQTVESTLYNHQDRAAYLNNLGIHLGNRYKRTGDMSDLEEAIMTARQTVESTPHNNQDRAAYLNNLGIHLGSRYKRTGDMSDLEEAITTARQTVESTPHDHQDRADYLNSLGMILENRYQRTGDMSDLEEASQHLHYAWLCQNGIPFCRIRAAARCLKLLAAQAKIEMAIPLGHAVIDLLPAVNTKFLNRHDQQFVMTTFAGIAADVCALLLTTDRPVEALECLERGRAVIISYLVDNRSDLSSLAQQQPELVRRYRKLRDEFNKPAADRHDRGIERARNERRQAADKLDSCIREIRETAGNERFLLGQTAAEMQDCAVGGTVILINITKFRSDAILVSRADIKSLNLPRLLASDAQEWLSKKWTGREVRRHERPLRNKEYLKYLAWLWEVCVQPVLEELKSVDTSSNGLPRVWWIGTGLASSMPFHAAGIHSPESTENAFNRVISSYTPSIKALEYAQRRARATSSGTGSLLITTMPTTPAQTSQLDVMKPPDLDGVIEESKRITDIARGYMPIEYLDLPSTDQVIDKLASCYIAHFACHGSTDHMDPSNSGLLLQKQGENGNAEHDWLTVHRVSELSLARSHIAYLSACSTAENKAARLSDEVIHVVSGFQVAGFPHVVGCMWPSLDWACVEVATGFYESLLKNDMRWDGRNIAMAVRDAVMKVREAEIEMPLAWAQFVHFGA
jgi:tetratricopeptide (TPR) repeat protein